MRIEQQIEYEAKNEAEAFQIARERLGREATVITSRPYKTGGFLGFFTRDALWVTAGIYVPDEEDLKRDSRDRLQNFQTFLDYKRAAREHNARLDAAAAEDAAPPSAFAQNPATVSGKTAAAAYQANVKEQAPQQDADVLTQKIDELEEKLVQLQTRLDGGETEEATVKSVQIAEPIDELTAQLIEADVSRETAESLVADYRSGGSGRPFAEWLTRMIPVMGSDTGSALGGRKVLFAGPTGVGKTTTIAKIASVQSLNDKRRVVLMTADTYRIAAVEQLRIYAKILGIPIEVVPNPKDIQNAMKKYRDADLILLDTAGTSHYDDSRIQELSTLYDAFEPDSVHLVAAANVRDKDMRNIIDRMGVVPLTSVLFTKLDETSSYGIMLNVLREHGRPLSFFTTGQNVPNDIEVARPSRFVDLLLGNDKILSAV